MAYSEKQWLDAEGYYKAGLSLSKIQEKTGISRSGIQKRAKSERWQQGENADYIGAKEIIAEKKCTKSGQDEKSVRKNQHLLNIADEVAEDNIRRKRLIYGNAELMASKIPEIIDSYIVEDKDEETGETSEKLLMSPKDLKELSEANDKLGITLGVADRHAPKAETNVNVQSNQIVSTGETVTDAIKRKFNS